LTATTRPTDAKPGTAKQPGGHARAIPSDGKEAARLRQQRSRRLRELRPREPATSFDPLEVGYEALKDLALVRASLLARVRTFPELDRVEEAIRRLSWGTD
jgi:hypothetical protein